MGTLINQFLLALAVGLASSQGPLQVVLAADGDGGVMCSSACTNGIASGNNVGFAEDMKYVYQFSAQTIIIAPSGTKDGKSEISITGLATIVGMQKCGALLYLKGVEITQGSKVYSNTDLEGLPVYFSYDGGKVSPNVCSMSKDSIASMNLKRAIVSALQVSSFQEEQRGIFETDIQGTCNTTYYSSASETYRTITKKKDLTQCTEHEKADLFGSSLGLDPVYRGSPFSDAVQHSEIKIADSTIKYVINSEIFVYQPFGPIDVASKIIVSMNLDLLKISAMRAPSLNLLDQTRSIIFEKPTAMALSANTDTLLAATQSALDNLEPVVEMDGAKSYADLIALLKVASKDDILATYRQVKSGAGFSDAPFAEKVFMNALTAANSGESIEAVAELIKSRMLSDSAIVSWFNNLDRAQHPTKEAVVAASNLLNEKPLKEGYTGVGTLLRKYLVNTRDFSSPEVENTLNNLGAPLKKILDDSISLEDEKLAIASLKGLGNVKYLNKDQLDLTNQIIMNQSVPQRIRAATLVMMQSYAKYPTVENASERIFTDISEDSELRILAFKVFSMNPSSYKATVIQNLLDDKNCQLQIQAFLISYLNNLRTTVDENKFDQKRFYEGINTKSSKRMLSDILRYSQSLEYSNQYPILRSGVSLDGEIIYSQQSYLARSSSASLKAVIFGRQIHVFDYDARIENIEPMLEKLFGPEGYFATNKGSTIEDIKNYVNQAISYAKSKRLNNSVDSRSVSKRDYENDSGESVYIDIALKVFGHDFGWLDFQGLENEVTYKDIIDAVVDKFDNSVPNKTNLEMSVKKQIPIIDYEKKYATSSGLPISMKIQATSAIKVDLGYAFDLDSYIKDPENSNFAYKVIPSGSLNFNTLLSVDGSVVEVGYKLESQLHTSTGCDVSLKSVKGLGFQMSYGVPLDVMDVLSVKSGAFSTVQERGSPLSETLLIAPNVARKAYSKTLEDLNNLGLSLNVQFEYPWSGEMQSLLPFSGPSSFSLKILKIDEKLTKYVLKGNYDLTSPTFNYVKLLFYTPKADFSRAMELTVIYDTKTDKKFNAELRTTSSKINLLSTYVHTDKQNTIEVKYLDGSSEHVLHMGVKYNQLDSETTEYSPLFEVAHSTAANGDKTLVPVFNIEGSFLVKRSANSYPSTVTLKDIAVVTPNNKHALQGEMTFVNDQAAGKASVTTSGVTFDMQGLFSGNYPVYKMDGTIGMTRNEPRAKRMLTDQSDGYEPTSKLVNFLRHVKNFNVTTSKEIQVNAPFVYKTVSSMTWDNGHVEIKKDILFKDNELTAFVNVSSSGIKDSVLDADLTVLPSTDDSGVFVLGRIQRNSMSDQSLLGHGSLKYVQNKDKRGGNFELNSQLPRTLGQFNIDANYLSTDDSFQSVLNYGIHDGTALTADMAIVTDDVKLNVQLDTPNPTYKSSINIHGWLENEDTYSFDTKLLWPGPQDNNYLNADGTMVFNGRESYLNGNIDFPSANLENVQVSIESELDSENEEGGIATLQFISSEQVLLSEKFKYKLKHGKGELYLSAESIQDDSMNVIPISFILEIKNYVDREKNNGKQVAYRIIMERDGQTLLYQKFIQVTKRMLLFRQIRKIDDEEQKISADFQYNFINAWNWSYDLKSRVISPRIFQYFARDDQNLMEGTSSMKVDGNSIDKETTLQIVSEDGTTDLYGLRWVSNNEKIAFKFYNAEREIRGLGYYSLEPIQGGYHLTYSGELWLDYTADPDLESTISIDAYYSLLNGLSSASDVNIFVPSFYDKDMGVKSTLDVFKSWENPLSVALELNIFPTTEQTLKVSSNLMRNVQDDGVLYSADVQASSVGMRLDYMFKDSILIANEKWGKHLDAYFIDSDNVKRPVQLHMELIPKGFTSKINVFDVSMVDVTSSFDIQDETLMLNSVVNYNNHSYSFDLEMTLYPSFKYTMGWTGKLGNSEHLTLEGYMTMDDSAVVSATHVDNNGKESAMGYVAKSLEKENWWATNYQMDTQEWNLIWKSLKGEFIERFIAVHSNVKSILAIETNRRKVRAIEAKKAIPQYHLLVDYTSEEWNKIFNEIGPDNYLPKMPMMAWNLTKAILAETKHIVDNDGFRALNTNLNTYSKNIYNYYREQTNVLANKIMHDYDELLEQIKLVVFDVYKMLLRYSEEPLSRNRRSTTEPHSFREYVVDIIYKLIKSIDDLNNKLDEIQDKSLAYIQSLPIYEIFHDQIEKLKSYPYKDRLWQEIHNYLQKVEKSAPTPEFASFMATLDAYINHVIHDYPESENDIPILRNKGILVARSIVFSFTDYVSYDRAMSMYRALKKLSNMSNTILYIVSPKSQQASSQGQNSLLVVSEYIQRYYEYLNPLNLLPPFGVQGVIIDSANVITYNGLPYSFKPGTGSYVLTRDFTNDKFLILGNYNDNALTSISVLSGDNSDVYELLSGGRITVNGQSVDFPLINDHVKTWVDVYSFGIDVSVGVSVKSTYNFDNVEVFVNGYYYGKVFGLLGSMYQEPTFDTKLPDGQPSDSMESFLSAYRQTGSTNPTIVNLPETDQPLSYSLFSSKSPMRGAFKTVDPTPYRALCNQLVSTAASQQDGLDKACLVAKAYVSMAKQNFVVNINIPDMCATTSVLQQPLDTTTQVQLSGPSDVADVMILFEETDKIKKTLSDLLSTFVEQITTTFNRKGIKDVNIIVIGYSADSDVHIYTASGNYDYSRILNNVPERLEPKTDSSTRTSQFIESYKKVVGKDSKDKAYKLSADYPFRTNALKAVLSIAQSVNTQNYLDTSQYTFNYITSSYLEQGITFNFIAPINLQDSSDAGIFGASGENTIYTTSAPQGKSSSGGYSHDNSLETSLVLKTNGVMYDIRVFNNAAEKTMKFLSRSIAQKIAENTYEFSAVEKSCSVSLYNGVMPYAKCIVVTE